MKVHYHTTDHHRLSHHSPWHNCRRPNHRCPPNGFMTWLCAGLVVHTWTSWFSLFPPLSLSPSLSNLQPSLSLGMALHQTYTNYWLCTACFKLQMQQRAGMHVFTTTDISVLSLPSLSIFNLPIVSINRALASCPELLLRSAQGCCCAHCFGSYIRFDIDMCWFNHHRLLHHSCWHNCCRHPTAAGRPSVP